MDSSQKTFLKLIKSCIKKNREAQRELYKLHYSFAMQLCMRYARSREEAQEAVNDGFMKVFENLKKYDVKRPFLPWLKQILVRTSIDQYKKSKNEEHHEMLETALSDNGSAKIYDAISYEETLALVRELPPVYQTVFNLYAIEGYKHSEIAEMLDITEGTSKSNYARAKMKLREALEKYFEVS